MEMTVKHVDQRIVKTLRAHKHRLTRQQYSTLRGQALAGDGEAALRGLQRLLARGVRKQ